MSPGAVLVLGAFIGMGLAALVFLLARRKSEPTRRTGPTASPNISIRTTRTNRRTLEGEEAQVFLERLPKGVAKSLLEVRSEGNAQRVVINVDGEVREYSSLEEVPEEFRSLLREGRAALAARQGQTEITIEVDGQRFTYHSWEEVPAEFRRFLPPSVTPAQ